MSLKINRRGLSAFATIIALVLVVGAGVGGWALYNMYKKDGTGAAKRDPDKQAANIYVSFTESLNSIVEDPKNLDEEVTSIKVLNEKDAEDLKKDFATATAEMKGKVAKVKTDETPKLTEAWGKAATVAGFKEKLEPVGKQLMDKLETIK
jgi:hypothetical protein